MTITVQMWFNRKYFIQTELIKPIHWRPTEELQKKIVALDLHLLCTFKVKRFRKLLTVFGILTLYSYLEFIVFLELK